MVARERVYNPRIIPGLPVLLVFWGTLSACASPNWWQPFSQLLWWECMDFVKAVVQLLGQVEDEDAVGNLMQDDQQDSAAAHTAGKHI